MSTNKRTTTKPTGAVTDRPALRVVPTATPVRTDTQNHLWVALKARSDSGTTAELAIAAGIGRSTAGKILAEWAKDGTVCRTPGGLVNGRRTPDRWTLDALAGTATPEGDTVDQAAQPNAEESTGQNAATVTPDDQPAPEVVTSMAGEPSDDTSEDADRADPTGQATDADMAVSDGEDEATSDLAAGGPAVTDTVVAGGGDEPGHGDPVLGAKPPRLRSGALRGLVEDYLRDHPTDAFGPGAIGQALRRSAGAVSNALDKLVDDGVAVRTQEAPKRFALSPAAAAAN